MVAAKSAAEKNSIITAACIAADLHTASCPKPRGFAAVYSLLFPAVHSSFALLHSIVKFIHIHRSTDHGSDNEFAPTMNPNASEFVFRAAAPEFVPPGAARSVSAVVPPQAPGEILTTHYHRLIILQTAHTNGLMCCFAAPAPVENDDEEERMKLMKTIHFGRLFLQLQRVIKKRHPKCLRTQTA